MAQDGAFQPMVAQAQAQAQPTFRLLVSTPVFDGKMWAQTVEFLLQLALRDVGGISIEWRHFSGAGVAVARNEHVQTMYELGCHAVLFLDADVVPRIEHVWGLLRHGVDIVGGLYPKKDQAALEGGRGLPWCANFLPGAKPNAKGLLEVENCGAGCLLVSRRAFDAVARRFPERSYGRGNAGPEAKRMSDFFGMGVVDDTYLTEDFYFPHLARQAGLKCYVDTQVRVDHMGIWRYKAAAAAKLPWESGQS